MLKFKNRPLHAQFLPFFMESNFISAKIITLALIGIFWDIPNYLNRHDTMDDSTQDCHCGIMNQYDLASLLLIQSIVEGCQTRINQQLNINSISCYISLMPEWHEMNYFLSSSICLIQLTKQISIFLPSIQLFLQVGQNNAQSYQIWRIYVLDYSSIVQSRGSKHCI